MSHPVNTEIFENLIEKWEIIPCLNGVGQFELSYENFPRFLIRMRC